MIYRVTWLRVAVWEFRLGYHVATEGQVTQWKPLVCVRGRRKPHTSRPSARRRSWHIFLHSNSSHRHSLQSFHRPPWMEKSRFRPFMYTYSGINGIGGLEAKWVNWPYQYQRLKGTKM